jgi:hypothetical protein
VVCAAHDNNNRCKNCIPSIILAEVMTSYQVDYFRNQYAIVSSATAACDPPPPLPSFMPGLGDCGVVGTAAQAGQHVGREQKKSASTHCLLHSSIQSLVKILIS